MKIKMVRFERGGVVGLLVVLAALLLFVASVFYQRSDAYAFQLEPAKKGIDMMVVIDNSCSMFPEEMRVDACGVYGNDPDFLRIVGSNLFIARLGFAENNEADYQAGVVSLGEEARLISPLQPLSGARDALARAIANPQLELATGIIPALELAYQELRTSPNRKVENLPAIVLITDGIPYPPETQTNADIERLVSENADTPLFIMLLQNIEDPSDDRKRTFEEYINFWQGMQARYSGVFTYRVENAKQIERTYNSIVAELQNTIAGKEEEVSKGSPLSVFISQYVQRIVVTIIHDGGTEKGTITITDSAGNTVESDEAGVKHFIGEENPVEVISIAAPRLSDPLKGQNWIVSSDQDQPVTVFLDRQGAYRINFLAPKVTLTDKSLPNRYFASDLHVPGRELVIRFNLLDLAGSAIIEPQPIEAQVVNPDGEESRLPIPPDLLPDSNGVYEIAFDPISVDPAIQDRPGRFTFTIDAGSADDTTTERVPIAFARLLVNIGRIPLFDTITPNPVICGSSSAVDLSVTVNDMAVARPNSLQVRVFGERADVILTAEGVNTFRGDISELCVPLIARAACGTESESSLEVVLSGRLQDGSPFPSSGEEVRARVVAPACTATPPPPPTVTPIPTATPTPTPTPIPDTDGDTLNDLVDQCPTTSGWLRFDGCLPPSWFWVLGLVGLAGAGYGAWLFVPWLIVRIWPPPKAYVLACKAGDSQASPKSTYSEGIACRKSRVTIGGDRKNCIYVPGLKAEEFVVAKVRNQVVIVNNTNGRRTVFNDRVQQVRTSQSNITLKVSLDRNKVVRC